MNAIQKEITEAWNEFVAENGTTPDTLDCKVTWEGDDEEGTEFQTIVCTDKIHYDCDTESVVGADIADDDILYYCDGLDALMSLSESYRFSDFKITTFIGFSKI